MIHVLRWFAIIGTCAFFWWVYQPHPSDYRKRNTRTFYNGRNLF